MNPSPQASQSCAMGRRHCALLLTLFAVAAGSAVIPPDEPDAVAGDAGEQVFLLQTAVERARPANAKQEIDFLDGAPAPRTSQLPMPGPCGEPQSELPPGIQIKSRRAKKGADAVQCPTAPPREAPKPKPPSVDPATLVPPPFDDMVATEADFSLLQTGLEVSPPEVDRMSFGGAPGVTITPGKKKKSGGRAKKQRAPRDGGFLGRLPKALLTIGAMLAAFCVFRALRPHTAEGGKQHAM